MAERHHRHIAADEEMLARFVLGTSSEAEMTAVEEHLASCDECVKAVQRERILAAGARRLGRDLMKDSLHRRVTEMPERGIPWPRILSAAAVVGILIGVGWYNDWFALQRTGASSSLTDVPTPHVPPASTPLEKQESGSPGERRDLIRPAPAETPPPTSTKRAATDRLQSPGVRTDIAEGPVGGAGGAPVEMKAEDNRRSRSEPSLAPPDVARLSEGAVSPASPPPFWVEGVQLGPLTEFRRADDAERKEEKSITNSVNQWGAARAKKDLASDQTSGGAKGMSFRIDQRSSASLPPERQMRQTTQNTVQTKVEQHGDMTVLTLYLDSLLNERDAAGAHVQTVADDSIMVIAGKQRIGLKLPAQFTTQRQAPAK